MRPNLFLFTAVLASSLSLDFAEAASNYTDFGHITGLETGNVNTMFVTLDAPFVNSSVQVGTGPVTEGNFPGGGAEEPCQTKIAEYALDPNAPGVKGHEAALLGAFFAGKKVRVRVDGCIFGVPKIVGEGIGEPIH